MTSLRNRRTGPSGSVRALLSRGGAALAFGLGAATAVSPAAAAQGANLAAVAPTQGVQDFYEARSQRLLWLQPGQVSPPADELIKLLRTATVDGLDPTAYRLQPIESLLRKAAAGDKGAARKADQLLSKAFVTYARDLRNAPAAGMEFIDPRLRPGAPSPRILLQMAEEAPSLTGFVSGMGWMNPAYARLRRALVEGRYANSRERDLLRINLARTRVLPVTIPRYVVVNAAEQRLHIYENGREIDSMKVVVGKQKNNNRTPMLASFISQASLNPYWNVPPDLAAERIAPFVLKEGLGYLKKHNYEVLSDWSEHPTSVDPGTIDWQAVADGKLEIRVRQLPGPGNSLGKVKFSFANPYGVYLHDTPDKHLLKEDTRLFSGGCIRLEDAARFGTWLNGEPLVASSDAPEIPVPLRSPVPIYVTYVTAIADGSSVTFLEDVYGWDAQRLAQLPGGGGPLAASY